MSEFEQRVAEALLPRDPSKLGTIIRSALRENASSDEWATARAIVVVWGREVLAPRVAAAITAARVSGLADELLPACDAAVFAALRGERP